MGNGLIRRKKRLQAEPDREKYQHDMQQHIRIEKDGVEFIREEKASRVSPDFRSCKPDKTCSPM
jgi:hypothetical protein